MGSFRQLPKPATPTPAPGEMGSFRHFPKPATPDPAPSQMGSFRQFPKPAPPTPAPGQMGSFRQFPKSVTAPPELLTPNFYLLTSTPAPTQMGSFRQAPRALPKWRYAKPHMLFRSCCLLAVAATAGAQPPSKPVIDIRGVTNFFTQAPAPATVAQGAIVQITGLNLGPADPLTATDTPWPDQLGDVQVAIDGKPAPLFSVSATAILAQVPLNATVGLDTVVVKSATGTSPAARVNIAAVVPAIRTANNAGYGVPKGAATGQTISLTADGLGPTNPRIPAGDVAASDTPAVPTAALLAYVDGLRAKVFAAASTTTPGVFDVKITVPTGARAGSIVTLLAARQPANQVVFQPAAAQPSDTPRVEYVALPADAPTIAALTTTGVNGDFLVASAARDTDGCYAAATVDLATKTYAEVPGCLTSLAAATFPIVAPAESDTAAALVGPPQGTAQTGISPNVILLNAAGAPQSITLPSAASALTATSTGFSATLPGTPPKVATIDPLTGDVTVSTPAATAAGAAATPITVGSLTHIYVDPDGTVALSQDFPAGWSPLLNAAAPPRTGQPTSTAPLHLPSIYDTTTRLFFVLARAADSSKDAFVAFSPAGADPAVAALPDGWFAASCTSDIRVFNIDLANRLAVAGSQIAEPAYKTSCAGSGFLILDFATAKITAVPLPDRAQMRVPVTKADTSLAFMNDYVFAARLDPTRNGISDSIYVLDGAGGSVFPLAVSAPVSGLTDTTVVQVPALTALLAQNIKKTAGDDGFTLFDLDAQAVTNIPVPDGFDTLTSLNDGTTVCCLATRKLVFRALKTGASAVAIYDLNSGALNVADAPQGITSFGPATVAAAAAAGGRLAAANARANTVYAVAYRGAKQAGIMVIHIP